MHYTVQYTGSRIEKDAQALHDCEEYLDDKFEKIVYLLGEELRKCQRRTQALRVAHIMLSFVGIQGRHPVRAMVRASTQEVA